MFHMSIEPNQDNGPTRRKTSTQTKKKSLDEQQFHRFAKELSGINALEEFGVGEKTSELQPNSPNCWMLLDYDTIQEMEELEAQLSGPGGNIEQTSLYIDPISARNWLKVASQANYRIRNQIDTQFSEAAMMVTHFYREYYKTEALDIIALGPGDGDKEIYLTQNLLGDFKTIRLLLLDVSHPLLRLALKRATTSMGAEPNIDFFAILGNFHYLQRYIRFFSPTSAKRKRLVTMLGHTWTNLSNEIFFIRNSLAGLQPGDTFLIDFSMVAAPADQIEEVKLKEPRLNESALKKIDHNYESFFTSTLKRYCEGFKSVEYSSILDYSTVAIPGSYTIERRAKVKAAGQEDRVFNMYLHKRYDLNQLINTMRQEGWGPIHGWPFGKPNDWNKLRMLYLFEKLAPESMKN